ncbi:MAG: hypothetical protein WD824_10335 [Cyclobacteriaceae bacterium]
MKNIIKTMTPILVLVFIHGCEGEKILKGTPECIEMKIDWISRQTVWNPPAKVYSYPYEGKTVFYFTARCCDFYSELYDKDCNLICAPDGGFSGSGDGKCPDFFANRTNELLIWEDERK